MIAPDTSAIPAILLAEEEASEFRDLIGEAGGAFVSAGTAVELAAAALRMAGGEQVCSMRVSTRSRALAL